MSEYKIGDKVEIRKDLSLYEYYGDLAYNENLTILPLCKYVVIEFVEDDDLENIKYKITGDIWISEQMIAGLYVDSLIEYQKRNLEYRQQLSDEYSSLSEEYNMIYITLNIMYYLTTNHLKRTKKDSIIIMCP